jgi:hypothetical protein
MLFMDLSFESDEIEGSKERVLSCVSVMGKRVYHDVRFGFCVCLCGVLVFGQKAQQMLTRISHRI